MMENYRGIGSRACARRLNSESRNWPFANAQHIAIEATHVVNFILTWSFKRIRFDIDRSQFVQELGATPR
jgi:hypothetical protein